MALQVRRVITGHDANGRAVVTIDDVSQNASGTTDSFPVDNTGAADEGLRKSEPRRA